MTWQPMQRATRVVNELARKAAEKDPQMKAHLDHAAENSEIWKNDRYTVIVYRRKPDDPAPGTVACLSIRRNDRGAVRDWRHMQKIKSELAGPEAEGFQIFPAESRLVDSANQTWIWCLPPGAKIPVGFEDRSIGTPGEAAEVGARQREFEEGILT